MPNNTVTQNEPQDRHKSFQGFFQSWIDKQGEAGDGRAPTADRGTVYSIIDRIILHYELYRKSKSMWTSYNITCMFLLQWMNTLEGASFWVGGWRPAVAFHVLFSKSGVQMEQRLADILKGAKVGDLGGLTESQLHRLDDLHKEVLREEECIMDSLKKVHDEPVEDMPEDADFSRKLARLGRIANTADGLRMATLMKIDDILTPLQRIHFRISGVEMNLEIHEWARVRFGNLQPPLVISTRGDGGGDHA